jgi:putative transcriptional regulator
MSRKAFDKIAEGLTEAIAVARGHAQPYALYVPPEMDVRAIRGKTNMTQDHFASAFGFTVHQIRQWEQARHRPLGANRAYLMVIDQNHEEVLALLGASSPRARKAG